MRVAAAILTNRTFATRRFSFSCRAAALGCVARVLVPLWLAGRKQSQQRRDLRVERLHVALNRLLCQSLFNKRPRGSSGAGDSAHYSASPSAVVVAVLTVLTVITRNI